MPLTPLLGWMDRIAASGHGRREVMSAEESLGVARAAEPQPVPHGVAAGDPSGLAAGDAVLVRTEEAGDPIRGTLVGADANEIVIRAENVRVGAVHVHFPRFGYSVVAA